MKRLLVQWCWLVAIGVMGACFSPQFQDGQITCAPDDSCPPGFECVGGVCRTGGTTIDGGGTTAALIVNLGGNGTGSVASNPGGISCGTDCTEEYAIGTSVTLTASPSSGSLFVGWSGGCSGTGACNVTLNTATTVTANFAVDNSLVVVIAGNGSGVVSSSPPGINCGADCTEQFAPNAQVVLTASAGTGSTFEGWSGAGCTGTGTCTVTADTAKMVTATFTLSQHVLDVTLEGNGTGSVASNPTGIDCGADCTEAIDYNTMVTLTATPDTGSTFGGWSGAGCTGTGTCTVTMTAAASVTATFTLTTHAVTVMKAGNGTGTVTSSPTGINCGTGAGCTASFDYNTTVTLSASPSVGSTFTGWSGAGCSGTSACVVSVTAATTVTATFTLNSYTLNVVKAGNGDGLVASSISGIDCGTDCAQSYDYNTMVTLMATPSTGSTFDGWSGGACVGSTSMMCTVTLAAATSVTATFTLTTNDLTVDKDGTGDGTITGVGINCGSDCAHTYDYGSIVTLSAAPFAGSTFDGWSGAGCSGTGTCVVTMSAARAVTAQFTLSTHLLTVSRLGNGGGSVTSDVSHPGIACGSDCTELYGFGSTVTLTASPTTGSTFTGWSGGGCTGSTPTCDVPISAATTVEATFTLSTHTLTVNDTGNGSGTITSQAAGINCGSDCSEPYNHGTVVTLTAVASTGSSFTGWSGGGCSGTGTCQVTMTAATLVEANFVLGEQGLTVAKAGNGSGRVVSDPTHPGIDCGTDCSENYTTGTSVTLTATADTGSTFTGWSGGGCSGTAPCTVAIASATTVTATFTLNVHVVSVTLAGTGSGNVRSDDSGINCGSDCSEGYDYGSSVRLTASASPGSTFAGWMGGNCTGTGTCIVDVTAATTVTAQFDPIIHTLNVSKSGRGEGLVQSALPMSITPGIDCGADCTEDYNEGTMVVLVASPLAGSTFDGWSGACVGTGTCSLTMAQAEFVDAQFSYLTYLVTVELAGQPKTGIVTADPGTIECAQDGDDCDEMYEYGTKLTLTATPEIGYQFDGWSGGGCVGNGTCEITVTQAETVTATFSEITHVLTVNLGGNGAGSVKSDLAGIDCGTDCNEPYAYGTTVMLTATPATGSTFTGWTGACTNTTGPCTVAMTDIQSVTASFTLTQHLVTVQRTGAGQGLVLSSPAGISCSPSNNACSRLFDYGTSITLTATAQFGSTFAGWSGPCASETGNTCTRIVTAAATIGAAFTANPPNVVFVTTTVVNGDMGGLTGADAACQAAATNAGLPANTYKAWLSTSAVNANTRLKSSSNVEAAGWVRPDGRPFAFRVSDITTGHLLYPASRFENNTVITTSTQVYTASTANGSYAGSSCNDWTSIQGGVSAGAPQHNSTYFTSLGNASCTTSNIRLLCFGVNNQAVVNATPPGPVRIAFTTATTWTPSGGLAGADAKCQSEAVNAGLVTNGQTFKALLATTTASAISRFSTTGTAAPWARRDGVLITGSASALALPSLTTLDASPNGNAANTAWYTNDQVWSGSGNLTSPGTNTCSDWTSSLSSVIGRTGKAGGTTMSMFRDNFDTACNFASKLVCLQE